MEAIYDITVSNNEHFVGLLEDIEDKIPTRAIVDSINASAEGLSLSLVADSEVTVAKTLQQLKSIPALTNVYTSSLSISEDEFGLKRVTFVIDARYNPEGFEANVGEVD
jgi:type IV pilus assembly protein PilM